MKSHNIKTLTAEVDPEGVAFTLRVKMNDGGEFVMRGVHALDTFMEMSCIAANCYVQEEEENDYLH